MLHITSVSLRESNDIVKYGKQKKNSDWDLTDIEKSPNKDFVFLKDEKEWVILIRRKNPLLLENQDWMHRRSYAWKTRDKT